VSSPLGSGLSPIGKQQQQVRKSSAASGSKQLQQMAGFSSLDGAGPDDSQSLMLSGSPADDDNNAAYADASDAPVRTVLEGGPLSAALLATAAAAGIHAYTAPVLLPVPEPLGGGGGDARKGSGSEGRGMLTVAVLQVC
jgi:hypothetical protein